MGNRISVITPSYKPEDYIWECLDSLYNQTLDKSEFEVIVVLNGCNEPWQNDILTWIKGHPSLNVSFIQTDQGGVSNARNIGIDHAKGEYMAFIDDDDYVSPSYLEELLALSSPGSVALTDSIYFADETRTMDYNNIHHKEYVRLKDSDNPSLYQSRRFFNGPVMKLIHKDIIGTRRFDTRFANGEDSLFMALISDRIKSCRFCSSDAVYYRRIRINSATTKKRSRFNRLLNCLKAISQYSKYWIKNPLNYNPAFMASRVAAPVKALLIGE